MNGLPRPVLRAVALRRFVKADDGAMIIFCLFLFVVMIMMGGMAVDLMRFENSRTEMQQTLDRSVLAAASLKQKQDAVGVVNDYFTKAGLASNLVDVKSNPTLNTRVVTAVGKASVPTFFMHMINVNDLTTTVGAKAEESVSNIEISLVLDISGSMRDGDQIGKLKVAAKQFFATVLEGDAATTTSINVIPYAGQVNVGKTLFDRWSTVRDHNDSNCVELTDTDYATMGLLGTGRAQTPNFMYWTIDNPTMNWGWCPTDNSAIQIAQNSLTKLNTFIDQIRLHDGTGTQTGVKYGVMLLNPALRSTFAALSGTQVPSTFANRPLAFSTGVGSDVQKYMIIMTDGNITDQYRPKNKAFFDPDTDSLDNEKVDGVNDPDTIDGIDYPYWNKTVELLNQPASNRNGTLSTTATNLANFYKQCNFAKANGVTVYTIAFNASTQGQTEMTNCATSAAHFFPVQGVQISSAFAVIARNIRQLRLTQ